MPFSGPTPLVGMLASASIPNSPAPSDDFVTLVHPSEPSQPASPLAGTSMNWLGKHSMQPSSNFVPDVDFFLQDALVRLAVEDASFSIHGYFFERESDEARSLLRQSTYEGHVVVNDIKAVDLKRFLTVLYARVGEEPAFDTKDEWASVLALAHRWNFASIRALAIRKLLPVTTAADQIVLATQYSIDGWKPDAYVKICEHATWPTPDDCRRLGVEELIHIGQAREALRSLTVPVSTIARQRLLSDIFGLPHESSADRLHRLRGEAERLEEQRLRVETKLKELQPLLHEAKVAEDVRLAEEAAHERHVAEAEAAERELLAHQAAEAERQRLAREAELQRLSAEAEVAELERSAREDEAKAAEYARKADEAKRRLKQSDHASALEAARVAAAAALQTERTREVEAAAAKEAERKARAEVERELAHAEKLKQQEKDAAPEVTLPKPLSLPPSRWTGRAAVRPPPPVGRFRNPGAATL